MTETITINGREFPVVGSFAKAEPQKRPLKYGNKPQVDADGVRHDSITEMDRDGELKLLALGGVITNLKRKPKFDLMVNGQKVTRYIGDWRYTEAGMDVVEDRKGAITKEFKIKWALAKALHPGIEWRLS